MGMLPQCGGLAVCKCTSYSREVGSMLNSPHWQEANPRPDPFVSVESRPLRLIICEEELDPSAALALLGTFAPRCDPLSFVSSSGAFGGTITASPDGTAVDYSYKDGSGTHAHVHGDWWKTAGPEEAARHGLDAATLERRFFFMQEAARRGFVDGLVMPFDDCLRDRWRSLVSEAGLMTVEEGASLMGLYLRARGERLVEVEPPGTGVMANEDRVYLLGALAMLPEYEVLHEGTWDIWKETGDPTVVGLGDAVAVRLGRALKARDYLHVRRRAPSVREIWSDVLYFFESLLICLQGALDAAARLLHELFHLKGSRKRANWGWADWWAALEASAAPVAGFDRSCLDDLDVLVGDLRNSIHGEVLTGELRRQVQPGEKPLVMGYHEQAVALDGELALSVSEATKRQGGLSRWSIRETFPQGAVLLDPWQYSEAAVVTTAHALSSVVTALATNHFAGSNSSTAALEPWLGNERQWRNAELLFGLEQLPGP